jgi:hypothetical protein
LKNAILIGLFAAVLAACTAIPVAPEVLARECAERARAATGPTGSIKIGTNSNSGGFASGQIGVSTDFLRGIAPETVYDRCWFNRTGELPTIPLKMPTP